MKLTLSGEQLNFFSRHGFLELEEFVKNIDELSDALDVLVHCHKGDRKYNIVLEDEKVGRALSLKILGEIVHLLVNQRPVRYAFDRFSHPERGQTIEEVSSVVPIIMTAVIALEDGNDSSVLWQPFIYSGMPQKRGSVCFVSPKVSWEVKKTNQRCLIIGFTNERAVYRFQEGDPNIHFLKKQGYVFGDALSEKTHPSVYR